MKIKTKQPELLAPAGEYAGLIGAVAAGADAVYLGGRRFNARATARNFTDEELVRGIRFAHLHGRRIYLTLNTLIKEREFAELVGFLKPLSEEGLDGVIVQDTGVLLLIRDRFPELRIHASTQLAVTGVYGARWLQSLGVSRVVPARELSLAELVNMKHGTAGEKDTPDGIEIEAFIHGAMCYSYSGMCLMSAMLGGRSGNRGRCAGACRLPYSLVVSREAKGGTEKGRREVRKAASRTGYLISLQDMCMFPMLQRLLSAKVIDSCKIEGRMKDPVYTAGVTSVYRKAFDEIAEHPERPWRPAEEDLAILKGLYLRSDLCDGYYFRHNGASMVTVLTPGYIGSNDAVVDRMRKRYLSEPPRRAVDVKLCVRQGEPVSLTLTEAADESGMGDHRAETAASAPMSVTVTGATAESARRQAAGEETLRRQLDRFGESSFAPSSIEIEVGEDVFVPASVINELRRRACGALEAAILREYKEQKEKETAAVYESECKERPLTDVRRRDKEEAGERTWAGGDAEYTGTDEAVGRSAVRTGVSVETQDQLASTLEEVHKSGISRIYLPLSFFLMPWRELIEPVRTIVREGISIFAALPFVLREEEEGCAVDDLERVLILGENQGIPVSGALVRNLEELAWLNEKEYPGIIETDQGIPLWNRMSHSLLAGQIDEWTVSPELKQREIGELICALAAKEPGVGDDAVRQPDAGIVLYGRTPMMVSANCVRKTAGRCPGPGRWDQFTVRLLDRRGKELPVTGDCRSCYNVIRNAVPTALCKYRAKIEEIGIRRVRIDFTTETGQEARRVLRGELPAETTAGRFVRGVE